MGERWVYEKQERNDNGYGDIYIGDSRAYRHDDYVRMHNADCDAYEKRIAELEAIIAPPDGLNEWNPEGDKIAALYSHKPAYAKTEADAKYLCECHNYGLHAIAIARGEQEYAEKELARVKAESLRVVESGEPVLRRRCWRNYFTHAGRLYANTSQREICNDVTGEQTRVEWDDEVMPVRLERWEDGE